MDENELLIESIRFWAAVDKSDGPEACWLWTKSIFKQTGYGQTWFRNKVTTAHRVAWILTNGDPGKLKVLHRCPIKPNRQCCNPKHLSSGTDQDNANDRAKDGNQARGERMGNAKLTDAKVLLARKLWQEGATIASLARQFNVDRETIKPAVLGKTWTHI